MTDPILRLRGISAGYGPVDVLHGIDVDVAAGSMAAILGANGAGKTTLLGVVSGVVPARGTIEFRGEPIGRMRTEERIRHGLAHVPEGRGTLMGMPVLDNLLVGAYTVSRRTAREKLEQVYAYFPILEQRKSQKAGLLSGGEQQMLAIGRGLMSDPGLLLVDELSLGLAPKLAGQITDAIQRLSEETGLAVLLVEQNAALALRVVEHAYVLNLGQIVMQGHPDELLVSDEMRKAYLGY